MFDIKERLNHLPSTFLGIASAAIVAMQGALQCQESITNYKVWLPAVLLAIWGGAIRGNNAGSK